MPATPRPFRFSVPILPIYSRAAWLEFARKAESLGYAMIVHGDHPADGQLAPLVAFAAAAEVTSTLRFGGQALCNDLRHPAMLAQEALTLDMLSAGRLELGIGAGWSEVDYRALGMCLDPGPLRLARLAEAVALIKQLIQGGPVTFAGQHYQANELNLKIPPAQLPRMPLFIGGGRRKILELATREADIVGLDMRSTGGVMDMGSFTAAAMDEAVVWVRRAAGERFAQLELHTLVHFVIVTDDRGAAVAQILEQIAAFRAQGYTNDTELSADDILESPHVLVGSPAEIVATLTERRARYGISHITVLDGMVEGFAPVVEQLAGHS